MKLTVNGEEREFDNVANLAALVEQLGLDNTRIALELNREVISRASFNDTPIKDGDQIEIVTFVGGG